MRAFPLGLLSLLLGGAAFAAPAGDPETTESETWVAVDALRGRALGAPKRDWRAALRDDAALRADQSRKLALYYVLAAGPGTKGQLTVEVTEPVGQAPASIAPGTYHVVATRVAKRP